MKRRVGIVTGTRAEYGYLKPLLIKIEEELKLELSLFVTGMHLLKEYGNTIKEIEKDRFEITRIIDMAIKVDNTIFDLAASIGKGVIEFTDALEKDKPDIMLVFGDRIEPFSAAVAAMTVNIPVAHINGGDVGFGDIDNNLRHAITKLAHLHFTSSNQSTERVLRLGEEKWRVFKVGALSLDVILNGGLLSSKELRTKYQLPDMPLILVSYHPVTSEWQDTFRQIERLMDILVKVAHREKLAIAIIYPNAYPGGFQIINTIRNVKRSNKNVYLFENLPHLDYISLMGISTLFIGNSSSGIIEAPSLRVPFVSVGTRQEGRERASNVIDVGYTKDEILRGIRKALFDTSFLNGIKKCKSPYGDGRASERIVKVLNSVKLDKTLLQKRITY